MSRRRFGRLSLLPLLNGVLLGSIVGALTAYVAVQHNPQGESYDLDSHSLVLQSVLPLFLSWTIPVAFIVFIVESLTLHLWRWLKAPPEQEGVRAAWNAAGFGLGIPGNDTVPNMR
jgi:hypothetical protein